MASGNNSLKAFRVSIGLANYEVFTMARSHGVLPYKLPLALARLSLQIL